MCEATLIVVGGGHAGAEAALAAARMGIKTLLITSCKTAIARMPCNPAIGGLAKSHLVYESAKKITEYLEGISYTYQIFED